MSHARVHAPDGGQPECRGKNANETGEVVCAKFERNMTKPLVYRRDLEPTRAANVAKRDAVL
jgi:hypothetical protein